MFTTTKRVIEKTEAYLLGLPIDNRLWSFFERYLFFPFKYLMLGAEDFFKPSLIILMAIFISLVVLGITGNLFSIEQDSAKTLGMLSFTLPLIIVIFAVPSTYAFSGVTQKYVNSIMLFLEREDLKSIDKIELFEENLVKIEKRISARVSFYKWLIGSAWTVYLLYFNVEFRIFLKGGSAELGPYIQNKFTFIIGFILISLISVALVASYKRASDILMKSIQFSAVDYKNKIIEKSNTDCDQ